MVNNDNDILKLLKSHDHHGLKILFDRYYKPLVIYSVKYVTSLEAAEDIVQSLFIRIWEKKKYMSISGSLRSYLFTSARNSSIDYIKEYRKIDMDSIEAYENTIISEERSLEEIDNRRKLLYAEIEKLSPQSKKVFEAIVFNDLKYKEVAAALGISVNTVKTLFSRSLKKLRNSLDTIVLIMLL